MKKLLFLFVAAFVCALGANAEVWKKVTSAPADWSGKYLIACDNGEDWTVLDGSRSGDPNSGNLQSTMNFKTYDVNANGDIELDACDYYVTIAPFGTGYSVCTASGWYLGRNDDSNGLNPSAEPMLNTIALDAEQGALIIGQGGCVLRYNATNGQDRFRYYKSSTYTLQQKLALYKLEEAQAPVEPEVNGYVAASKSSDIKPGCEIVILNRYGWGAGTWRTSDYMWYHNDDMDQAENSGNPIFVYDGDVNVSGCPTSFLVEEASNGNFYLKDLATGKYLNGAYSLFQDDTPDTAWSFDCTDSEKRHFDVYYLYNGSKRYLAYGSWMGGGPLIAASNAQEQPKRIYVKGGVEGGEPEGPEGPEEGGNWDGTVIPSLTSFSSLDELEGMTLTFPGAKKVELDEEYGYFTFQNEQGSDLYAVWAPGYGGEYEVNGNVVTIHNLFVHPQICVGLEGVEKVYMEDYGMFIVDGVADYFNTVELEYTGGAAVAEPFDLVFRNNNVVCESGKTVEASEYGVASDFYLALEGLTAKGNTATLYKDGQPMSFAMTFVDERAVSFFGGSSLFTEPGTYLLEVPAGTYVDAQGNPSNAFYGTWVLVQKDEPVPGTKDKYTIKLSGTDYYFTTTEVKDNSVTTYSISATPEYFYIEPSGNGFTIQSADNGKFVGYDVISSWDFSNDEKVWYIGSLEGEPTLIRKNSSKGFGVDNRFEGAGVYTDKSGQYWVIEKYVEVEPEPTIWNGNINYSEAATLDDVLALTVEFEEASSVEASGFDILGAIFDEVGNPYAIVEGNGVFDIFGQVSIEGGKVNLQFKKISDLSAAVKDAAKAGLAKIGGFVPANGKASVVFAAKSFVVDGTLVESALCHEYELGGSGVATGIESIAVENGAQIFDLQGRRVRSAQNGMYIVSGKKIVK